MVLSTKEQMSCKCKYSSFTTGKSFAGTLLVEAVVNLVTHNLLFRLAPSPFLIHHHTQHVQLRPTSANFRILCKLSALSLSITQQPPATSTVMTAKFVRLDATEAVTFRHVIPPAALARHCPLDNGHHTMAFDNSRAPDLGTLTRLPVELQLQVILQLDVASLLVWMR